MGRGPLQRVSFTSVLVAGQEKALRFYTEVLGFVAKRDVPAGDHRWLTVVSPQSPGGVEVLLEPTAFQPAADYQRTLRAAGIPLTAFAADDIVVEVARLRELGVAFTMEPTSAGPVTGAVFDDTCGNSIQRYQE